NRPRAGTGGSDTGGRGRLGPMMSSINDVAKLYEEFEEAFVDVLTAKSEGVSFSRRMKLRLARSRLRAHKDFTQREYDAAVLIRNRDTGPVFDWLMAAVSYQGISDQVAYG